MFRDVQKAVGAHPAAAYLAVMDTIESIPSPLDVPEDHQVITIRTVMARPESVFRAWTEANYLKEWWGPHGFSNTFHLFEPRPGGRWSFVMHGPDNKNYPNESVFIQLENPGRVMLEHQSEPHFQVDATFDAIDSAHTHITFRMKFATRAACDKLRAFVTGKNEENMDRLEAVLARMHG
ncbi:MAG: SRPBCC domain-containing protein [Cyclobacteriaceae bacterium]